MPQENLLFPPPELEPFTLDTNRVAPAIQLDRFSFYSGVSPSRLVRSIAFHAGLNIVRTAHSGLGDDRSAAHDAGKSLLIRLLRYSLGEPDFGSSEEMRRIRKARPNGRVVCEWTIGEQPWTVVRPLREQDEFRSYAVLGHCSETVFNSDPAVLQPLDEFVRAASTAGI